MLTARSVCYCCSCSLSYLSHNSIKEHRLYIQVLRSIDEECAITVTAAMTVVNVAKDVHTWSGSCYPLTETLAAPVVVPPVHLLQYHGAHYSILTSVSECVRERLKLM
jgi:hypothetical protein